MIDGLLNLDERLHGYQIRAVRHLWENPRSALFLDMGLGKSFITLAALTPDHLPALVVGPKRVTEYTWPLEVKKWRPDLDIAVASGTASNRKAVLTEDHDITTLGVANIKDAKPRYKTIVFDEMSLYKSHDSNRWRIAKDLARFTNYVWGLTGTPSPNGLIDLWAQLYLLDHGERLGSGKRFGTGIGKYRSRYFIPGEMVNQEVTKWLPREGAQEEIQEKISDICMSMRSEDYLELPPVTYNTVHVPFTAHQAYENMRDHMVHEDVTAANAGVKTGKLCQITAGFLYTEDGETIQLNDDKAEAVAEIVAETGSPVLVFYWFKAELAKLKAKLPQARTIDEPGVLDDWNEGKVPLLLAHPASAGHGLSLQDGGHTIIWATLTWSPELYNQANARLARQGQKNPVLIHHVASPGTIDTRIPSVLDGKITIQDAVMQALDRKSRDGLD